MNQDEIEKQLAHLNYSYIEIKQSIENMNRTLEMIFSNLTGFKPIVRPESTS
jgi:hypothetical protein